MSTPELPPPITDAPSEAELAERLARVRALMAERGLDVYVSFDPTNVYYLTNFANYVHERPFLLVIRPTGRPTLLAPLLEAGHVRQRSRADLEFATYPEFPAPDGENHRGRPPFELLAGVGVDHPALIHRPRRLGEPQVPQRFTQRSEPRLVLGLQEPQIPLRVLRQVVVPR